MSTDGLDLLTADHLQLRRLFTQQACVEPGERAHSRVVGRIVRLITVHTFIEDEVLYPRVRRTVPHLAVGTSRAHQEHRVVNLLCVELCAPPEHVSPGATAQMLASVMTRHMVAEETVWFPQVREGLSTAQLSELGVLMIEARRHAPTAPSAATPFKRIADPVFG